MPAPHLKQFICKGHEANRIGQTQLKGNREGQEYIPQGGQELLEQVCLPLMQRRWPGRMGRSSRRDGRCRPLLRSRHHRRSCRRRLRSRHRRSCRHLLRPSHGSTCSGSACSGQPGSHGIPGFGRAQGGRGKGRKQSADQHSISWDMQAHTCTHSRPSTRVR